MEPTDRGVIDEEELFQLKACIYGTNGEYRPEEQMEYLLRKELEMIVRKMRDEET